MSFDHKVGMSEEQYTLLLGALETSIEDLNDKIYEREDDYSDEDRDNMHDRIHELEEGRELAQDRHGPRL